MVVNLIGKHQPVKATDLEELFKAELGIKNGNGVYRYLQELKERSPQEIEQDSEGRYVLMGRTEAIKPPSEVDFFLLDEAKRLVSDIIASGLGVRTQSNGERWDTLFGRCQSLEMALNELSFRRSHRMKGWKDMSKNSTTLYQGDVADDLREEMLYFLGVIDNLSKSLEKEGRGQ